MMYFETWRGTMKVHRMAVWNTKTWDWLFIPDTFEELSDQEREVIQEYSDVLEMSARSGS